MTTPVWRIHGKLALMHGSALGILPQMGAGQYDAIVTDPPYGLEFMGKDWDRPWAVSAANGVGYAGRDDLSLPAHRDSRNANCRSCGGRARGARRCTCAAPSWDRDPAQDMRAFQDWCLQWATEAYRLLKPGGHLVAFGGTRTYHRLACALEDAGFEIRDSLHWLYGTGWPKSREVLKPAHEPIVLARKPLAGTVAANMAAYGTGALNIDGCRLDGIPPSVPPSVPQSAFNSPTGRTYGMKTGEGRTGGMSQSTQGRWPPNVIFTHDPACVPAGPRQVRNPSGSVAGTESSAAVKDVYAARERVPWQAHGQDGTETVAAYDCAPGCPVAELDAQSGLSSEKARVLQRNGARQMDGWGMAAPTQAAIRGDAGGASRFFPCLAWEDSDFAPFRYQAKAPRSERPVIEIDGTLHRHPTVKPVALMRWLVRLVAAPVLGMPPPVILDPFAGTSPTGAAALAEGVRCVLIEQHDSDEHPYIRMSRQRLGLDGDPVLR